MAQQDTKNDPDAQAVEGPETPATVAEAQPSEETDPLAALAAQVSNLGETVLTGFGSLAAALQEQRDEIEAIKAAGPAPKAPAPKRQVGRDTVRFFSTSRSYRLWLEPLEAHMIDGRVVRSGGKFIEFTNHITDVDAADEETLAVLHEHPSYGRRFWEDPTAKPRGVRVQEGAKSTGRAARAEPSGELVAAL